jgi:hypothetical protein
MPAMSKMGMGFSGKTITRLLIGPNPIVATIYYSVCDTLLGQ